MIDSPFNSKVVLLRKNLQVILTDLGPGCILLDPPPTFPQSKPDHILVFHSNADKYDPIDPA